MTAPVSLIVSAFAPCGDVREVLTPALLPREDTTLLLIDLGRWTGPVRGFGIGSGMESIGADTARRLATRHAGTI